MPIKGNSVGTTKTVDTPLRNARPSRTRLRNSSRLGIYADSSGTVETHLARWIPRGKQGHPHEAETTETAGTTVGLREMTLPAGKTLPGRPIEEVTERLSTP